MIKPIYCLNGPNLNLLGQREPDIYGNETLSDICKKMEDMANDLGVSLMFRQTNYEGELVQWVQEASSGGAGLIINAAAYSHTSIALHDALKVVKIPLIEVHLSNPGAREDFRHKNYVTPNVSGFIAGFGAFGYILALQATYALITGEE